jgi:hypothetical protein
MKVKTTIYVHYLKYEWEEEGMYEVFSFKAEDECHRTYICQQEIEIDVPEDYDPRAQQIAALEKKRQEVMAAYQKTVTEINERINKLQALEHSNE